MACSHYNRGALLLAPCCNEFFPCRFCHDLVKDQEEKDPKKAHTMDRKAVKQIKCLTCQTVQDAKQVCEFCHTVMGTYWCPLCVLLDNEDKGQYHCDECGICRVGGSDNHIHCDQCDICVNVNSINTHVCLNNAGRVDCSVCLESLHESRDPIQFLPCGHGLHRTCCVSFYESGQMACPLCKKSVHSEDQRAYIIQYMDAEIQRTPMPEEYRLKRVKVVCNDCEQESITPFHIVGLKCSQNTCGSYNTVKIGEAPDAITPPAPEQQSHN